MTIAFREYPVKLTQPATHDVEVAHERFLTLLGAQLADDWEYAFFDSLRELSRLPTGYQIAENESRLLRLEIRAYRFARSANAVAYRVYYTVVEDQQHPYSHAGTPPFILVLHVRHGARRAVTRREVERLRDV